MMILLLLHSTRLTDEAGEMRTCLESRSSAVIIETYERETEYSLLCKSRFHRRTIDQDAVLVVHRQ